MYVAQAVLANNYARIDMRMTSALESVKLHFKTPILFVEVTVLCLECLLILSEGTIFLFEGSSAILVRTEKVSFRY